MYHLGTVKSKSRLCIEERFKKSNSNKMTFPTSLN